MDPIKPWKVVELSALTGGSRAMNDEADEFIATSEAGNDCGKSYSVGSNERMPLINEWLLNHGFQKDERLIFWISW